MPLCRLLTRLSLPRHAYTFRPQPLLQRTKCLPAQRSYSTALDENRRDELDLNKVPADSAYLDFILGSSHSPAAEDGDRGEEHVMQDDGSKSGSRKMISRRQRDQKDEGQEQARKTPVRLHVVGAYDRRVERVMQDGGPNSGPSRKKNRTERAIEADEHARQQKEPVPVRRTLSVKPARKTSLRRVERLQPMTAQLPMAALQTRQTQLRRSRDLALKGIRVRNKWMSLRYGDTYLSSYLWEREMAKLQQHYHPKLEGHWPQNRTEPSLRPKAKLWAQEAIDNISKGKVAVLAGLDEEGTIPIIKAIRRWQNAALWLAYHRPEKTADFLRCSHVQPYPPAQNVSDLLEYCAAHFTHSKDPSKSSNLQALADVVPLLANREDGTRLHLDSSFCAFLIPHCTDAQVHFLYQAVKQHHAFVMRHTFLHFATYFAKHEQFDQALDAILSSRTRTIGDLNSVAFRSTCSTLLRNAIRHPDGLRLCLRIVDNLVNIGLKLNTQIANIVMLNAVEAGDLSTAFTVHDNLFGGGLEADKYTYGVLLKACKASIDDADTLNRTIRMAIQNMDVLGNPVVATEILHCLALHHTKHNPEKAFETVLDAYAQLFDMAPMRKLGMLSLSFNRIADKSRPRMQPPQQAVGIMIATYLEHSYREHDSTEPAYELYKRYRLLAEAHVEPFASSLKYDYMSNAFLETFIKSKKGLLYAAEVIKDMQKPSSPEAPVERSKPTVQTWSIFLHGFSRHRQLGMAEQILTYMRGKGIEPNNVTYNTLTAGYASVQDIEGTLDVLRRMEADGHTWDHWTMKSIGRIRDQETFMSKWESGVKHVQLDFTSEIKENLSERIAGVAEEAVGFRNKTQAVEEEYDEGSYVPMTSAPVRERDEWSLPEGRTSESSTLGHAVKGQYVPETSAPIQNQEPTKEPKERVGASTAESPGDLAEEQYVPMGAEPAKSHSEQRIVDVDADDDGDDDGFNAVAEAFSNDYGEDVDGDGYVETNANTE